MQSPHLHPHHHTPGTRAAGASGAAHPDTLASESSGLGDSRAGLAGSQGHIAPQSSGPAGVPRISGHVCSPTPGGGDAQSGRGPARLPSPAQPSPAAARISKLANRASLPPGAPTACSRPSPLQEFPQHLLCASHHGPYTLLVHSLTPFSEQLYE